MNTDAGKDTYSVAENAVLCPQFVFFAGPRRRIRKRMAVLS